MLRDGAGTSPASSRWPWRRTGRPSSTSIPAGTPTRNCSRGGAEHTPLWTALRAQDHPVHVVAVTRDDLRRERAEKVLRRWASPGPVAVFEPPGACPAEESRSCETHHGGVPFRTQRTVTSAYKLPFRHLVERPSGCPPVRSWSEATARTGSPGRRTASAATGACFRALGPSLQAETGVRTPLQHLSGRHAPGPGSLTVFIVDPLAAKSLCERSGLTSNVADLLP